MTNKQPPARRPGERDHSNDTRNAEGRLTGNILADTKAARAALLLAKNPGMTYRELARRAGYSNHGDAWRAVQSCRQTVKRAAGKELVDAEAAYLDDLYASALEVLERDHVMVSHGRIITRLDPDTGEEKPLLDFGPKLAAIREMRAIRESYRKLFGVDERAKIDVTVHEVSQQDLELQEMLREAKARVAAQEQTLRDGPGGEG